MDIRNRCEEMTVSLDRCSRRVTHVVLVTDGARRLGLRDQHVCRQHAKAIRRTDGAARILDADGNNLTWEDAR